VVKIATIPARAVKAHVYIKDSITPLTLLSKTVKINSAVKEIIIPDRTASLYFCHPQSFLNEKVSTLMPPVGRLLFVLCPTAPARESMG
jgi:hypothetical protein